MFTRTSRADDCDALRVVVIGRLACRGRTCESGCRGTLVFLDARRCILVNDSRCGGRWAYDARGTYTLHLRNGILWFHLCHGVVVCATVLFHVARVRQSLCSSGVAHLGCQLDAETFRRDEGIQCRTRGVHARDPSHERLLCGKELPRDETVLLSHRFQESSHEGCERRAVDGGALVSGVTFRNIIYKTRLVRLVEIGAATPYVLDVLIDDVVGPHVHTAQTGLVVRTGDVAGTLFVQSLKPPFREKLADGQ